MKAKPNKPGFTSGNKKPIKSRGDVGGKYTPSASKPRQSSDVVKVAKAMKGGKKGYK